MTPYQPTARRPIASLFRRTADLAVRWCVRIGRQLSEREAAEAVRQGVTAVLDLTGEFTAARPFLGCVYRNLAILDLTAPTQGQLAEAVAFITEHAAAGVVYVHCKAGYSRSAAVAAAYLLASGQADTARAAVAQLRQARPQIVVRPEALAAIEAFARRSEGLALPAA